jgi:oligoendopeptidase F
MQRRGSRLPTTMVWLALCLLAMTLTVPALGAAEAIPGPNTPRDEVPAAYQWNPYDIFPDEEAWSAALAAAETDLQDFAKYQGHLGDSADVLYACLQDYQKMDERLSKLYSFANLIFDVDQSNSESQARLGRVRALFPKYGRAVAFVEPELLSLDEEKVNGFLTANDSLRIYDFYYRELLRQKDHTLSEPEEQIMALAGNVRGVPGEVHGALMNVDLRFPEIVDENGQKARLTMNGFPKYRASPVYAVRKQAAEAFFGTLRQYENTMSTLLDGVVKGHIMNKEARGYDSCLEAALYPQHISTAAYRMLIATLNENLPRTLHKYIALRKKVLGLDGPVTFANLYNPMLDELDEEFTYDQGRQLVAAGLAPLGDDYHNWLLKGMNPANGWTDIYPNLNKDSGAYSNGSLARDVHPYVKQNFDGTLDAVFTTAHEFGHALHSVYSQKNQPPVYAGYTTFLAEVASTCNEALLTNYMLRKAKSPLEELMLLNQRLESIRLTIFRQTLFAEFELRAHEHAEAGNSLTPEFLNGLYKELITKYYGPDYEMGENDECEWMFIPHFYYNFYVFTYATGLTSGLSLAEQIDKQGDKAAHRYIDNLLKAGASAPPLEILRNAGVDLETPRPILDMLDLFEQTINEFDRVWTKSYGNGEQS